MTGLWTPLEMNIPKIAKNSHWLYNHIFKQEKHTVVDFLILEEEQKWPLWEEENEKTERERERGRERENDIEKTLKLNHRITKYQMNQYYD